LLERTRSRWRDERIEIDEQAKRPKHADQVRELCRLSALEPHQRPLRDARFPGQIALGEIALQAIPSQALAKQSQDRRIA